MLPGVEVARRRRLRSPVRRREADPPYGSQITTSLSESRRWRGGTSSSLAHHHHHHHHHHHYHHHHYHNHPPRAAPSPSSASTSTQARRLQDLLQEHRAVSSQQQNNNVSLLTSSEVGPSSFDSRGFRGFRGEESRISRLAMLLRGQSNERRLQGEARKARDRLDERLRAAALVAPRLLSNPPRRAASTVPSSAQYDLSVLFSDDEEENLWSDDEDWERSMREWLAAWAPSLEDRWQPDLFSGNSRPVSMESRPLRPREGLAKAAIEAIKRETYGTKQSPETDREQEDCPVCLEKFVAGQELLALPCNHRYHPDCLTPWLEGHEQCPCCRAQVEVSTKRHIDRGETGSSSQSNEFISWMSALERGMSRLTFTGS